ncbi:hypothetical protein AX14_010647 [Amanita brunnescens Koide BX004]|nr:hypothetical protein AX14_010647 [Amanita brunnescens Koide BX004]
MFKRIEKRLKRREEERQLGIDDETRDILGLNDTDSEESESDSDLSIDAFEAEGSEDDNESEEAHDASRSLSSPPNRHSTTPSMPIQLRTTTTYAPFVQEKR